MAASHEDPHEFGHACVIFQSAIELAGRRWNGAIIFAADHGVRRYSEFLAAVPGISERMLAQRLRELEEAAVLVREVVPTTPVQITYTLSERGRELARAVEPLIAWGERWLGKEKHD
ncbi:HTH-type transcriptional regulator YodB [Microtetraspora sp. NBRC 13810]|uniref:winged helix-turn-helix transcriptional regulator n=1 Tax=Microtetraspora sp. NBRC 13810 TaxID=3030990 RepID=UPI002555FF0F|nr:helix-turn-helix domain-containing protein [Microtetraspora sp. NBRC 13810]GLW09003.1 HTH-type transcriptional regulator YodB [Microtetraspora sp. NBRC 13810]